MKDIDDGKTKKLSYYILKCFLYWKIYLIFIHYLDLDHESSVQYLDGEFQI